MRQCKGSYTNCGKIGHKVVDCPKKISDNKIKFTVGKIKLISNKRSLYKFKGEAFVQNNLVASSEFSAMLVNEEKAK